LIVATDNGIFHKMQLAAPGKTLLEAPYWRTRRNLRVLRALPVDGDERIERTCSTCWKPAANEIWIDPAIGRRAVVSINRMLAIRRPCRHRHVAGMSGD
jgi:quinolinate synthase